MPRTRTSTTPTTTGSASTTTRALAALAGATGLLHLVLVPEYLEEKPYVGVLFLLGGVALVAAAWVGHRAAGTARATSAWVAAAAVTAGMLVGGVASRTTGLPGFHPHDWELSLLVSLVLEVAYLALWSTSEVRRQVTA